MTIFAALTEERATGDADAAKAEADRKAAEVEAHIRKLAREEARAALDEEIPADDSDADDKSGGAS